jgi:predicted NAD/FAD-dependent oxidoreductase
VKNNSTYDVLIIGAGISGLAAAKYLEDQGLMVKVLDKGKAPGGRLATKRLEYKNDKIVFDYGAVFIEGINAEFKDFTNELLEKDIVRIWHVGNYNPGTKRIDLSEKYAGKKSMREIALHLAGGLNISVNKRVELINWGDNQWNVITADSFYKARSLILTMPNPQAMQLLDISGISIPHKIKAKLETVRYEKTITALLILDGESGIMGEGGVKFNEGPVSFITDNNIKGINKNQTAVTVEMSHSFSSQYWDSSDAELAGHIVTLAKSMLSSNVVDYHIHKWRYSKPSNFYSKRFEFIEEPGPLYLAGDSFLGNNLESAYLSGIHSAKNLYERFSYQLFGRKVV